MKEKPILFSGPMVRALLDGRKTMTRRIVPGITDPDLFECLTDGAGWIHSSRCQSFCDYACGGVDAKAKYKTGDVLWVREKWAPLSDAIGVAKADPGVYALGCGCFYAADAAPHDEWVSRWRPSIHMPRQFCRLRLRVTAVKAERVQDISEEDAIREGVEHGNVAGHDVDIDGAVWNGAYRRAFALLWNSINGPGSWEANPWVWCYTFEVIK